MLNWNIHILYMSHDHEYGSTQILPSCIMPLNVVIPKRIVENLIQYQEIGFYINVYQITNYSLNRLLYDIALLQKGRYITMYDYAQN